MLKYRLPVSVPIPTSDPVILTSLPLNFHRPQEVDFSFCTKLENNSQYLFIYLN